MPFITSTTLTPREVQTQQYDKEILERQMAHAVQMKQLEIEVQKLEAKWSSWIKLPLVLITLPVRILMVIPLTVYALKKQEVPEAYWKFLA